MGCSQTKSLSSPETEESLGRKAENSCGLYSFYKVRTAEMGAGICSRPSSKVCFGGTEEMGRLTLFLVPFAKIQIAQIMVKFTWQKRPLLKKKRRKKKEKKKKISSEYQDWDFKKYKICINSARCPAPDYSRCNKEPGERPMGPREGNTIYLASRLPVLGSSQQQMDFPCSCSISGPTGGIGCKQAPEYCLME